jgi:hypothetical protein
MHMRKRWNKAKNPFPARMTATFSVHQRPDAKFVAHSLDFDIVCVDDSEAGALDDLRLAVKTYVEFGLANGWAEDVIFPAPDEYWERLDDKVGAKLMSPIVVDDNRLLVLATMAHELQHATGAA